MGMIDPLQSDATGSFAEIRLRSRDAESRYASRPKTGSANAIVDVMTGTAPSFSKGDQRPLPNLANLGF
jgi:hypothetical protein